MNEKSKSNKRNWNDNKRKMKKLEKSNEKYKKIKRKS